MTRVLLALILLAAPVLNLGSIAAQQPKLEGKRLGQGRSPMQQSEAATAKSGQKPRVIDFTDPTYGGRIRQIYNPTGDEHDLYHYRSVFNADNSRLLGIETPQGSKDYLVTLYDGDGGFRKHLFTQVEYDWTVAWDRRDPRFFYTRKHGTVYRYEADAGKAEALTNLRESFHRRAERTLAQ